MIWARARAGGLFGGGAGGRGQGMDGGRAVQHGFAGCESGRACAADRAVLCSPAPGPKHAHLDGHLAAVGVVQHAALQRQRQGLGAAVACAVRAAGHGTLGERLGPNARAPRSAAAGFAHHMPRAAAFGLSPFCAQALTLGVHQHSRLRAGCHLLINPLVECLLGAAGQDVCVCGCVGVWVCGCACVCVCVCQRHPGGTGATGCPRWRGAARARTSLSAMWPRLNTMQPRMLTTGIMNMGNA